MWIEELDIRGFRRLRRRIVFGKGLNVVLGEQEAGKTTVHQAVVRALFGFAKEERRKQSGQSLKDRCAPWDGGHYGINALVREARGRSLRIEWDFSAHSVRLLDAETGADLSAEVRGKKDDVRLGRYLLGIDLEEFREACCMDQAVVAAVQHSEDLVLALRKAIESGRQDVGVEDANEILSKFLGGVLGVHAGHMGQLAGGALATAISQRRDLEEALSACRSVRDQVAEWARQLQERERVLAELESEGMAVEQAFLRLTHDELDRRLQKVHDLEAAARDVPADPLSIPESRIAEVMSLREGIERLEERLAREEEGWAAVQSRLQELESAHRSLAYELDSLAAHAGVDTGGRSQVLELRGRLAAMLEQRDFSPVPIPRRDPLVTRFREQRPRLEGLAEAGSMSGWDPRWLSWKGWLIAALVVALAAVATGLRVHVAGYAGLLIATALLLRAVRARRSGNARRELGEALAALSARSIEELDDRVGDEDRVIAAGHTREEERQRLAAEREAARSATARDLHELLDRFGVPPIQDLEDRSQAYLVACGKRVRHDEAAASLSALTKDIELTREPERALTASRRERHRTRSDLVGAYVAIGIDTSAPAAAAAEFDLNVRRARADAERLRRAKDAEAALQELLGGRTRAELERRHDEAARLLSGHAARHGELGAPDEAHAHPASRESLEAARRRNGEEGTRLRADVERLRTLIADRETKLADPAELEERLEELAGRIDRLERTRKAVVLARATLQQAAREVHQEFAPHLNAALRRNLPRITRGRYRQAVVDDELRIQVLAPETGRFVSVSELSRGTQDQIYLVERLEVARLLDPTTGEAPLLLDDPFARFDEPRRELALQILSEAALDRQIMLFSDDTELADAARAACPSCTVIELPGPPLDDGHDQQLRFPDVSFAGSWSVSSPS
ncbi:MAG: AAA family ATPase [Gemmatimonadetes bacterium]|nr:AAA family ATPase [Gemmatimonadota bacterium]